MCLLQGRKARGRRNTQRHEIGRMKRNRRLGSFSDCLLKVASAGPFCHHVHHKNTDARAHTHTHWAAVHPPTGFSPVYPGIQGRPWPDWAADRGSLWCWVSCAALSASSPASGRTPLWGRSWGAAAPCPGLYTRSPAGGKTRYQRPDDAWSDIKTDMKLFTLGQLLCSGDRFRGTI